MRADQRALAVLSGKGGVGKCHQKGENLLLSDGSKILVEDVRAGNELLGPDGFPRLVLSTSRGHGKMVEIRPIKGEPFTVNNEHVLTLVRTNGFNTTIPHSSPGEMVDVPIPMFNSWNQTERRAYVLIRSEKGIVPVHNNLPLDPYFLGVLLGDGSLSCGPISVTTMDKEITNEIFNQASLLGMKISRSCSAGRARTYFFSRIRGSARRGPLLRILNDLGVWPIRCEDRFVPEKYLKSTWEARAQVLAGLIDTDGCLSNKCYDYVSKSEILTENVAHMARSLGLCATVRPCTKKDQNGHGGTYYRATLSGETDRIPCRIPSKIAPKRLQKKNALRTGFTVHATSETEDYFGFTLSGDGRYLLSDFTVTHNTSFSAGVSLAMARAGKVVGANDLDVKGPDIPIIFGVKDGRMKAKLDQDGTRHPILCNGAHPPVYVFSSSFYFGEGAIFPPGETVREVVRNSILSVAWPDLDLLVLDMDPSTGDAIQEVADTLSNVQALMVTEPRPMSLGDCHRMILACKHPEVQIPIIGIVANKVGAYGPADPVIELANRHGVPYLGALEWDTRVVEDPLKALNTIAAPFFDALVHKLGLVG